MNNAFDPAQLGGNMRGIVGSKLFGKSLPKHDTVSQFLYGTSSARGGNPSIAVCGKGYTYMNSNFTWTQGGKSQVLGAGCYCYTNGIIIDGQVAVQPGIVLAEDSSCGRGTMPKTDVLVQASTGKKAGAVIGGCRFPVSAGSNPPFGTMGVQVANGKPCSRETDGIHLAV